MHRNRYRPMARANPSNAEWYRIENKTATHASVMIYEEIGYYGVSANDFVREIGALQVDTMDVLINSPGGDVWDGLAIYNALKSHPATVTTKVDGIAASAASFIFQAGDVREIARNGQVMIHDAAGMCIGNASDMQKMMDLLDKASNNIADIYAQSSGIPADKWRAAMLAETWYSGSEAVASGLADLVTGEDPSADPKGSAGTNSTSKSSLVSRETLRPVDVGTDYDAIKRALKEAFQ